MKYLQTLWVRIKTLVLCRRGCQRRKFIGHLMTTEGHFRVLQCPRCGKTGRKRIYPAKQLWGPSTEVLGMEVPASSFLEMDPTHPNQEIIGAETPEK